MVEEKLDRGIDSRLSYEVVIVQYQQSALRQACDVIDQTGKHDFRRRCGRRIEQGQRCSATLGGDRLDAGDEVAENLVDFLVALVKGKPRDGAVQLSDPRGQQGRVAG